MIYFGRVPKWLKKGPDHHIKIDEQKHKKFSDLVHWIEKNLKIEEINDVFLIYFFQIYGSIQKNSQGNDINLSLLLSIRNTLIRIFVDRHRSYAISSVESILLSIVDSELSEIKFDNGSGLYPNSVYEEVQIYVVNNFQKFSKEFQIRFGHYLNR